MTRNMTNKKLVGDVPPTLNTTSLVPRPSRAKNAIDLSTWQKMGDWRKVEIKRQ